MIRRFIRLLARSFRWFVWFACSRILTRYMPIYNHTMERHPL